MSEYAGARPPAAAWQPLAVPGLVVRSLAVGFHRVPHGQFRLALDIDFVWRGRARRAKRSYPRQYIQAARKEEMQAHLDFIYQLLTHRERLVIGYEIVRHQPNGKRQVFRYLRVGERSEMEVDLGERMLLKQRNGRPTMYREMTDDEL